MGASIYCLSYPLNEAIGSPNKREGLFINAEKNIDT